MKEINEMSRANDDNSGITAPNRVELMYGWCSLMEMLLTITWMSGVVINHQKGDNLVVVAVAILLVTGFTWLPGILVAAIFEPVKSFMARFDEQYHAPSFFEGGMATVIARCGKITNAPHCAVTVASLIIGILIVVCNTLSLIGGERFWYLALVLGAAMSFIGALITTACITRDFVRGIRRKQSNQA